MIPESAEATTTIELIFSKDLPLGTVKLDILKGRALVSKIPVIVMNQCFCKKYYKSYARYKPKMIRIIHRCHHLGKCRIMRLPLLQQEATLEANRN